MSSAPSKKPPSADPTVDLDYSVDDFDFEIEHLPDSTFLFQRMEDALVREGTVTGGRTLDVACGVGKLAARFQQAGGEAWGIEPSADMLALSRFVIDRDAVALTRGVAETLPFQDATFDRISGLAVGPDGRLYVSDAGSHRLRRFTPRCSIEAFAGSGIYGFSGDGGPAIDAELRFPGPLAMDTGGTLYLIDRSNRVIRRITPEGVIDTVAGCRSDCNLRLDVNGTAKLDHIAAV